MKTSYEISNVEEINCTMAKRRFMVLAVTACVANTVGFLSNAALFDFSMPTIVCGVCAALMVLLTVYGRAERHQHTAAAAILFIINLFEFPYLYYIYRMSTLVYMLLGLVGIVIFFPKKARHTAAVLVTLEDMAWFLYGVSHPSPLGAVSEESAFGAMLCSFVIVAVSITSLLLLMVRQYEEQQQMLTGLNERIADAANRDPLTGLYNRRYLANFLDTKVADKESVFAVVLLDLDDFKNINDTYGHVFGDTVLATFSAIITEKVAGRGIVARFGGEEFMIVFEEAATAEIQDIMAEIRDTFVAWSLREKQKAFTFSGGVEMFRHEDYVTQLFNAVDEKLYRAKKQGKNRVVG